MSSSLEANNPAEVDMTSWIEYSVSIARPDNFVDVLERARGILAMRSPLRNTSSERRSALARSRGSHPIVTVVCVTPLWCMTGAGTSQA